MRKILNKWRFYGLGEDEYKKCMEKIFFKNIIGLRRTNGVVAVLLACFLFVPIFIDKNPTKAMFFIGTVVIAAILHFFIRCKYDQNNQEQKADKKLIHTLIFLSYANVISFGLYLGVWANPGNIAGSFLAILICALILFNISPIYYLCLTLCSVTVFVFIVIMKKSPEAYSIDIPNALFAGIIALFFGWQIIMNRLSLASVANKMENERNNYYDQSIVDELTQLKNRRDFMNTFQRFLTSYRQSDNYLCIAILDIDFFKNYNDHYGHPKGDECLHNIGKALKDLQSKMNVYAARIGGEEFALIWFEEEASNVHNAASQIRAAIRCLNIPHEKSDVVPYVTISIGICVHRCGTSNSMDALYDLADRALYNAKKNGRNRAVITSSEILQIAS
ncbi:MAG: GGDEF domain-containing protein [Treponema sp.]|jgi:diguanylate cyclase (GGDEF)-like protein|nr:GGDEF domain-containing protein [Treponema sp.]